VLGTWEFAAYLSLSSRGLIFRKSVEKFADLPCLGKRDGSGPYTWETYAQVGKKVDDLGSALAGKDLPAKSAVSVYGANCPEWMMTMQVCASYNACRAQHHDPVLATICLVRRLLSCNHVQGTCHCMCCCLYRLVNLIRVFSHWLCLSGL
jgi:hypothetical protein